MIPTQEVSLARAFAELKQLELEYPRLAPRLYRHARKSRSILQAIEEVKRLLAMHSQPTLR